jgi:hypothetical protein
MEDPDVKIILILELQMVNKLLNDNYKSEELVFFNEMDHEIHNQEFMTEINVSVVSTDSTNVFAKFIKCMGIVNRCISTVNKSIGTINRCIKTISKCIGIVSKRGSWRTMWNQYS